jgi:hypothetical protein
MLLGQSTTFEPFVGYHTREVARSVIGKDLSAAIEGSVEREPAKKSGASACSTTTTAVTGGCGMVRRPAYLNTGRSIKSKFLRATLHDETLVVENLNATPKPE